MSCFSFAAYIKCPKGFQSPGTSSVCQYHLFEGETPYVSVKVRDVEQNKSCSMELKENSIANCTRLMPVYTLWINGSAIKITFLPETANGRQFNLSLVNGNLMSLQFHSCGFMLTGEYPPYLLWMFDFMPIYLFCLQ